MSATAPDRTRDESLEELRLSVHAMLTARRRLRSRDGRDRGQLGYEHHRLQGALRRAGRLTASGLAAATDISPATATEMIDALVEAGLVERRRDQHDRRVVHVALTPKGRRTFDAKQARLVAAWSRELEDLDAETLDAAAVVLDRLATFFDRL